MRGAESQREHLTNVPENNASVGSLLASLGDDVGQLISTEANLAKAEIALSLDRAKTGVMHLAIGGVVFLSGFTLLLFGLAQALAAFSPLPFWGASLAVGGAISAIGTLLLFISKSNLSTDALELDRSEESLRKTQRLVEENF